MTKKADQIKTRVTCSCGYKVRGKNHAEGSHHKQGKTKKK